MASVARPPLVRVGARTGLVALLGDPVHHSVSPAIHNAALVAQGVDLVYVACQVRPQALKAAVRGLSALGAIGANVTIPHKEAACGLADCRTPEAEATGAANTLVRTAEGWMAANTDIRGFLAPLKRHLDSIEGARVCILGAGGAARAVGYALLTAARPSELLLVARQPARGQAVLEALRPYASGARLATLTPDEALPAMREAALIVNATPAGMYPHAEASPISDVRVFRPGHLVYDLVYRPAQTRLLREAAAQGARTLGGLPMLLHQAASAYALWTGLQMPMQVAQEAATRALHSDQSPSPTLRPAQ